MHEEILGDRGIYPVIIDLGNRQRTSPHLHFCLEGNRNCIRLHSRHWEEGKAMLSLVYAIKEWEEWQNSTTHSSP
jgi:hypothetical protein